MFHSNQRKQGLTNGIFSLWKNWVTAVGFLAALTLISPLVPPKWVPLTALFLEFVIIYLERTNRRAKTQSDFQLPGLTGIVLFITAILSLLILLFFYSSASEFNAQPVNPRNPILITLILSPVTVLVSCYYILRDNGLTFRRTRKIRNGDSVYHGFLGSIFIREARYQTRVLFVMSAVITLISWIYYFTIYVNININDADSFFFIFFPTTLYILSLIYLGARYYTMWTYYTHNEQMAKLINRSGTRLRFIILCGDKIFLAAPSPDIEAITSDETKIDTPVKIAVPYRENIGRHEVDEMFRNASGINDAEIRFLFVSNDYAMYNNIFHYMAFVDDPEKVSAKLKGEWFTLTQVNDLVSNELVATVMAAELSRIYTVAMTWKTYDRHGYRLYKIKHYKPTFRLRDIAGWNVDFNDDNWLHVAKVNQDIPFFCIRRFWEKHIKGLGS